MVSFIKKKPLKWYLVKFSFLFVFIVGVCWFHAESISMTLEEARSGIQTHKAQAKKYYDSSFTSRALLTLVQESESFVGTTDEENSIICEKVEQYEGDKCNFVKKECPNPNGDGFINFFFLNFCVFGWLNSIIFYFFCFIFIAYLFFLLGDLADVEFSPSLVEISKYLRLSEDVAGVTFLALGNGAPDLASIFLSIAKMNSSGLGVGEPIGAGLVISTLVFGLICLLTDIKVPVFQFFRDIFFYMIAVLFALFCVLSHNTITLWESILFLVIYFVYVMVVVFGDIIKKVIKYVIQQRKLKGENKPLLQDEKTKEDAEKKENNKNQDKKDIENKEEVFSVNTKADEIEESGSINGDENQKEEKETKEVKKGLIYYALGPLRYFGSEIHWSDKSITEKIQFVLNFPVELLRLMTIPRADPENWSKLFTILSVTFFPYFTFIVTQKEFIGFIGPVPIAPFLLLIGVILGLIILFTSRHDKIPCYHFLLVFAGFAGSIVWIYFVANELVNLLQTLGILFNISDSLIGLLVLSWGNSIGDLFGDIALAKKGKGKMAIAVIFAGPALNLLIGLGFAVTVSCIKEGNLQYVMGDSVDIQLVSTFITLFISLFSTAIVIPLTGFKSSKLLGCFLILLYVIFTVFNILIEVGVLFPKVV